MRGARAFPILRRWSSGRRSMEILAKSSVPGCAKGAASPSLSSPRPNCCYRAAVFPPLLLCINSRVAHRATWGRKTVYPKRSRVWALPTLDLRSLQIRSLQPTATSRTSLLLLAHPPTADSTPEPHASLSTPDSRRRARHLPPLCNHGYQPGVGGDPLPRCVPPLGACSHPAA
jgi:hypothetical protein